jgi:glycosyltransferase involved in cell wall biosynthesis
MNAYPYRVSFIVPALNEEVVIQSVVEQIFHQIDGRFADHEIILVDDGSTDATGAIMDLIAAGRRTVRVLHNPRNLGFGNSFQRGLREARFEYVMLLCGDGGLPATSLPAIFEKIGSADIVVPWMLNLKQIKTGFRYALSRLYTTLMNVMFGLDLHYYNGLPVHRRDLLQKIEITSGGFGFQAEILIKLIKSGCSYVQVGIQGAERTQRSSAMRARNWLSVGKTIAHLVVELIRFKRVPSEMIARRPKPVAPPDNSEPEPEFPKH